MTTRSLLTFGILSVLPILPLLVAWQRLRETGPIESTTPPLRIRIETIATTLSFVLLLAGMIWSPVLGPDYSRRRFATMYGNLAVVALVCVASLVGPRRHRLSLSIASAIVALEWIYLAVVNSVV